MDRLPRQPKQFRGTLPTLPLLRVDDILKMFGAYGRFQVSVVLLLNLVNLFWASQLLSLMFISTVPPFHCVVDGLPTSVDVGGNVTLSQCTIVYYDTDVNVTTDCEQWAYSKQWPHTIVGEWDLVCSRSFLAPLSTALMFIGVSMGARIAASLSDRFGRQRVLVVNLVAMTLLGSALAAMPNIWSFMITRAFLGFAVSASGITAFVLRTEWLPSNARIFGVFFLGGYTWSLGVALLAIGSYLMPNWRHLQLAISVPSVLLWSFHWLIPESLHWLTSQARYDDGLVVLQRMTRVNRVPMPAVIVERVKARRIITYLDHCSQETLRTHITADSDSEYSPSVTAVAITVSSVVDTPYETKRADATMVEGEADQEVLALTEHDGKNGTTTVARPVAATTTTRQPPITAGAVKSNLDDQQREEEEKKERKKTNNVQLPVLTPMTRLPAKLARRRATREKKKKDAAKKYSLCDICRHPELRRDLLIFSYIWFSNCALFFGIAMVISSWPGNRHVIIALFGLLQIPADGVTALIMALIGRKKTLFLLNAIGAIAMLLGTVLNTLVFGTPTPTTLQTVFGLVAKCCIEASLNLSYLYSAEVFPTVVRNIGTGCVNVWARIGGVAAVPIMMLSGFYPDLPYIILSTMTGVAALLSLGLQDSGYLQPRIEDVVEYAGILAKHCRCCGGPTKAGDEENANDVVETIPDAPGTPSGNETSRSTSPQQPSVATDESQL